MAPLHPLIFPGFPFMKTRVLSGRVGIYGVLALVWIWGRLRVQTWTWKLPRAFCMLLPLGLGWSTQ